jgi:integrase
MPKRKEFPYLFEDVDRHGNKRVYVRRTGLGKIRLHAAPGSVKFAEEYWAARRELEAREKSEAPLPKPTRTAPPKVKDPEGSLGWLIAKYLSGGEFAELTPRTRRVRQQILDKIRERPEGKLPYRLMQPRHVAKLRDEKVETPEGANALVKALRQVFAWAILPHVSLADTNPAAVVPYLKSSGDGFHTWTIEEVEAFEARHPSGTKARLALALLLNTGVRRSDVVKLGRQHKRDGWLTYKPTKNSHRNPKVVTIPILPELQAELDAAGIEGQMTFLQTEFGKPYTAEGFGNWFRRRCDEAGLPHCTAHGLRKAGACLAAEGGATEHQLMAIYGWETIKEAEKYTRKARRRTLAEQGMPALSRGRGGNRI